MPTNLLTYPQVRRHQARGCPCPCQFELGTPPPVPAHRYIGRLGLASNAHAMMILMYVCGWLVGWTRKPSQQHPFFPVVVMLAGRKELDNGSQEQKLNSVPLRVQRRWEIVPRYLPLRRSDHHKYLRDGDDGA